MNKFKILFLIYLFLISTLPVTAYDTTNFRQEYKPTYGSGDSYKSFSDTPSARLQPKSDPRVHNQLRDFSQDPQSTPRYNSSCQFGMCLPGGPGQSKNSGNH